MRKLHVVAAVSTLSLVLAAPAFSADVQDTQKQLQKEKQDVREKRKELRQEVREQAAESTEKLQQMRKASSIIGTNVKNGSGETLGEVKELVLDVDLGRVAYFVVSSGGVLGVGEGLHAVPASALSMNATKDAFILNVDKKTWEKAPGFDKDHWPDLASEQWQYETNRFYERGSTSHGSDEPAS